MKKTNPVQDFLGVPLTELQTSIALALSAGGTIKKLKQCRRYYIRHPKINDDIILASVTLRSLQRKGILDKDLVFTQTRWCD